MSDYITFWSEREVPKELLRKAIKINGRLLTPLQKKILYNRGFDTPEKIKHLLCFSKEDIPTQLPVDMEKCASIVIENLKNGFVTNYSDYDVDGWGCVVVFVNAMRDAGFEVGYWTNTRKLGFGLKNAGIDGIIKKYPKTTLVLTSDNGIVHFETCEYAYEKGLKVCITDHHEPAKDGSLPHAEAIVDCKRHDETYPFRECCGTAIMYKLCREIYRQLGMNPDDVDKYLDIVACATVADVVPVIEENRYYLIKGLEIMNGNTKGYWDYIKRYVLTFDSRITPSTIGFSIGPLINACSRINGSISIPLQFFLMEDSFPILSDEALDDSYEKIYGGEGHLSEKLKTLDFRKRTLLKKMIDTNNLRKDFTDIYTRNLNIMANEHYDDNAFTLWADNFHTGIMGISAGRICELSHRPTICMTNDIATPDIFTGSGRAPKGANLIKALQEIDEEEHLFVAYGGHELACGLTVKKENLEKLRDALNRKISSEFKDDETIYYDERVSANADNSSYAEEIAFLAPFGQDFEEPIFLVDDIPTIMAYPSENPKHMKMVNQYSVIDIWNICETWRAVGFVGVKYLLCNLDTVLDGKTRFTSRKGNIAWDLKSDEN